MSNNYIDKYGRYHDKPVSDRNNFPCNNSWLYTAYSKKLGFTVDESLLAQGLRKCKQRDESTGRVYFLRNPYDPIPPFSHDEVLGLAYLGYYKISKYTTWNFSPYPIPKFNLKSLISQTKLLYKHRSDRNYFWENKLDQIYRFAFSVPLTDRHFILQCQGKFNIFYWAIAKVDSMLPKKSGIRWLKYDKSLEAMQLEFSEHHPFRLDNQINIY